MHRDKDYAILNRIKDLKFGKCLEIIQSDST